jgi:hypothetical protein
LHRKRRRTLSRELCEAGTTVPDMPVAAGGDADTRRAHRLPSRRHPGWRTTRGHRSWLGESLPARCVRKVSRHPPRTKVRNRPLALEHCIDAGVGNRPRHLPAKAAPGLPDPALPGPSR